MLVTGAAEATARYQKLTAAFKQAYGQLPEVYARAPGPLVPRSLDPVVFFDLCTDHWDSHMPMQVASAFMLAWMQDVSTL